jgi:LAS seventeen-binding protein 1/2
LILTTFQIRTELEFLCDTGVISTQQLSSILAQLPAQTPLRAPVAPIHASATSTPVEQLSDLSMKDPYTHNTSPAPLPPPAYAQSPPVLAIANALYAYQPTDTGDLALQPNDNIQVLEHMNNDCKKAEHAKNMELTSAGWRGRNERTGLEGIFPRSYVNVIEEKGRPALPHQSSGYGNMPLDIANGSSSGLPGRQPSRLEEHGKKFGKKMGNAAIFGAGATIGSNIVNGIF